MNHKLKAIATTLAVALIVALPTMYANESTPPDAEPADRPHLQTTITAIASGDWEDPTTWDLGSVPTSADHVVIPSPYEVYYAGGTIGTPDILYRDGTTLVEAGATLSIPYDILHNNGSFTNYGIVDTQGTTGGTIRNAGTFDNHGAIFNHETLDNQSSGTLNNYSILNNLLAATVDSHGTTNNYGTITNEYQWIVWSGTFTNYGIFDSIGSVNLIRNDSIFINACGGTLVAPAYYVGNPVEYGLCTAVATGDWDESATWDLGVPTASNPVVIPGPHTVTTEQYLTRDATTDIGPGGSLVISGGNQFTVNTPLTNDGSLTNYGDLIINGTTLSNNSTLVNNNSLLNSGVLNNACGATFTNNGSFSGNPVVEGCGLTIVKDDLTDSDTAFDFTGDLGAFTLQDPSAPSLTVNPGEGTFAISETPTSSSYLVSAICDNGDTPDAVTVNDGDFVTCTFVNDIVSSITIVKDATPADGTDFAFFSGDLSDFTLDDASPDDGDAVSNSITFTDLTSGIYSVSEGPGLYWEVDEIVCDDPDGQTIVDTNLNRADIDLDPGEDITCTFFNKPTIGTITIVKDSVPDDGTDFLFVSNQLGEFTLDDAAVDDGDAYSDTITFDTLFAGTYQVIDTLNPIWEVQDIVCDDPDGETIIDVPLGTVDIDLDGGEDITCTFTNLRNGGNITIIKDSIPADGTDFLFIGDLGTFTLDDAAPDDGDAYSDTITFTDIPAGSWNVIDAQVVNWSVTAIVCNDPSNDTFVDALAGTAYIELGVAEDITCTFTNERTAGSLTVIKDATPADGTDFTFSLDVAGPTEFTLDDASPDDGDAYSDTTTYNAFPPGTYPLSEIVPAGWTVTAIVCDDPSGDTTVDVANAEISLAMGLEDITCTFSNAQTGNITIVKGAAPEDGTDFQFTSDIPGYPAFTLDEADPDDGDAVPTQIVANDLLPGTYTVSEVNIPAGWSFYGIVCEGTAGTTYHYDPTLVIALDPGEDIVCTYANTKDATITVIKESIPEDGTDFSFTGDLGDFTLDDAAVDDGDAYSDRTSFQTFTIPDTAYRIEEMVPTGWTLTSIDCVGALEWSIDGNAARVRPRPDEQITCTFTNLRDTGTVTIIKQTTPDGDPTSFNFDGGALGTFDLADDGVQTFTDLTPGAYTVSEALPTGWTLANLVCTGDTDNGSTIDFGTQSAALDVDAGEDIVCTFTNEGTGDITITKSATPSDGASFDFSGDLGAFSLMDGESVSFSALPAGSYAVTESLPANWSLESIVCDDLDSTSANTTATIDLDPGESIICTFNNASQGTVVIEKRAEPNDTGHVFNFSGDLGDFSLRHGQSATFDVPAGSYAVTELVPDGWTLNNIRCDDNTFVLNNDTVTIDVQSDTTITCIFNNETLTGAITIYKESIPADGTAFDFGGDLGAFSLADGQHQLFINLSPGAYTITENVAAGWFLSEVRCASTLGAVDASVFESGVTVNLRSTEFVNCVFTNRQQSGIIEIIVDNWPADGTDFGFSGDLGSFVLDDAAGDDGDNYGRSIAFAGLAPGSYTISELVPPNWSLLSIRCASSDPASTTSVAGSGVSVNLSGDALVSCTFSNQASGPNREPVGPREDLGPAPGTVE